MTMKCPKCGKTPPDDALYCPYCAHGLTPAARTDRVSVAGVLMIIASASSFILFALSLRALLDIYRWYPRLVMQDWFIYNQLLIVFAVVGLFSGAYAARLTLWRSKYNLTMLFAAMCTASGFCTWITSMMTPHALALNAFIYYFLPMILAPAVGLLLIYPRKPEFR